MALIDRVLEANSTYSKGFPGPRPLQPALHLAVVACMDSRLALFGALGLRIGDAHLMRNAGGIVTEDILRSLAISQRKIGTREVLIIQHTNCGMEGLDDAEFRGELESETGLHPNWDVPGFQNIEDSIRESVERVRNCPWIPHRDSVHGLIFDVNTAQLTQVV